MEKQISRLLESKTLLFLSLFAIFTLLNFNELTNPPYWDEILGLHNQALFLAKSDFDFASLYQPEQGYVDGGSCVYPLGILPLIYGLLYWMLPPAAVHVAGHLINLAALAFGGTLLFSIIRRFCSFRLTLLWVLATLTEPVLTGRMAAQGQEAVLAAVVLWSIWLFFRNRPKSALATAILCCFIKLTGIVLLLAYGVWFLYSGVRTKNRRDILLSLASFGMVLLFFLLNNAMTAAPLEGEAGLFNLGFPLLKYQLTYLIPWIALKTVLALGGFALLFFSCRKCYPSSRKFLILPIFICGFFAAYFLHSNPQLVRYFAMILLPLGALAAYGMRTIGEKRAMLVALAFLALQLLNQNGALLPELPPGVAADPSQQERSREFLRTIEMDREAARVIEENYSTLPIVCKWPHVQMLTMPELRYVTQPLKQVRSIGIVPRYTDAPAADFNHLDGDAIYLYAANSMDRMSAPGLFPPQGTKILLLEEVSPERPGIVLFTGIRYRAK